MNYLAHAYLSFKKTGILTGNMISDHVKGKLMYEYDPKVLAGIRLHRLIDNFTDQHPSVKHIKTFFSPSYGLYSAVFADVILDYFLANDTNIFTEISLKEFTSDCYSMLDDSSDIFPLGFARIFPHMKSGDWLANYRFDRGIENSFRGLACRAKYMNDSSDAFNIFLNNKAQLHVHYLNFFPELKAYSQQRLKELMGSD